MSLSSIFLHFPNRETENHDFPHTGNGRSVAKKFPSVNLWAVGPALLCCIAMKNLIFSYRRKYPWYPCGTTKASAQIYVKPDVLRPYTTVTMREVPKYNNTDLRLSRGK